MSKIKYLPGNENGSVIVAALMILALLTIIGFAAINTSTTEQHLATNTLLYERAFYVTEAGFEHAKAVLKLPYTEQNQGNIALGNPGTWTFALNGSGVIPGAAAAADSDGDGVGDFLGGVELVQSDLEGILYTVTIWNNDDSASVSLSCPTGGKPNCDSDGMMLIRSVAKGPRGATCTIESLIEGTTDSGNLDGYKAQAGAGSGKSYSNNDRETIIDFKQQM